MTAWRIRRASGVLVVPFALLTVALGGVIAGDATPARAGEAAAPPREVKLSWQIVAEDVSIGAGCSVTAFLQIGAVRGADLLRGDDRRLGDGHLQLLRPAVSGGQGGRWRKVRAHTCEEAPLGVELLRGEHPG